MRVAKKITDRVADLIENLATNMPLHRDRVASRSYAWNLRSDAYLAYLDGRVARSRALNKLADELILAAGPEVA